MSDTQRALVPEPEQQPPLMHVLPAQQGLPATPQGRHVLVDVSQTTPVPVHCDPGQQGFPATPQLTHWLGVVDEQMVFASEHVPMVLVGLVGQQAWLALPQTHDFAVHVP